MENGLEGLNVNPLIDVDGNGRRAQVEGIDERAELACNCRGLPTHNITLISCPSGCELIEMMNTLVYIMTGLYSQVAATKRLSSSSAPSVRVSKSRISWGSMGWEGSTDGGRMFWSGRLMMKLESAASSSSGVRVIWGREARTSLCVGRQGWSGESTIVFMAAWNGDLTCVGTAAGRRLDDPFTRST